MLGIGEIDMGDVELKRCPFCNGEVVMNTEWKANGKCVTKIECFCGASMELIGYVPFRKELAEKWNKRVGG